MKRIVIGTLAALASMALLTGVMLPLRDHLSIATTALVLVVPVVIGVVIGGFAVGVLGVIAGFLVYDFFFIPPYLTLWVGRSENWAALFVYAAVMLPVARTVAVLNVARARERRQGAELRELFELSGLLLEDKKLDELLTGVVSAPARLRSSCRTTAGSRWRRPSAIRSVRTRSAGSCRRRENSRASALTPMCAGRSWSMP
jgi:two-component system sensor histidine kinase KdpD